MLLVRTADWCDRAMVGFEKKMVFEVMSDSWES